MCSKRMAGCPVTCAHRRFVLAYREERERQETLIENNFRDLDDTDYKPITFKQYLTGLKGR